MSCVLRQADAAEDVRLCRCQGMTSFFGEAVLDNDGTLVQDIDGLPDAVLVVEQKAPGTAWPDPKFGAAPNDEAQVEIERLIERLRILRARNRQTENA